jgi:hypothetical protein
MIWTIIYALPVIMAILFLSLAAVYHGAAVREAMREDIENHSIRSVAIRVSVYSMLAFVSVATRTMLPDVKDHGSAICLIAAGLPVSIAWGVGVYRSVRQIRRLL